MNQKILIRSSLLILLLLFMAQTLSSASSTSLTIDEGLHIASGYTILRTGDYRLVEEHPPLVKMWAALPLLPVEDIPEPTALPAWKDAAKPTTESLPLLQMAQQLIYPYQPLDRLIFPPRAMITLLGVILLAVIFRWSEDLWGNMGALLACALATFDPNLITHAAVAGTDLGAVTLTLLALFVAWRFFRRPSHLHAILVGAVLALALTAKLNTLLLLPVLGLTGLTQWWLHKPLRQRLVKGVILLVGTTGLLFWAIYGFQVQKLPGLPFALPAAYHSIPFLRLQEHLSSGHSAFLAGKNSLHGWWYYFPVALILKTPLPTLLLLMVTIPALCSGFSFSHFKKQSLKLTLALLFPLLYFVSSLLSSLNIGYRHLLPVLPFLYIWIGKLLADDNNSVNNRWKTSPLISFRVLANYGNGTHRPPLLDFLQ